MRTAYRKFKTASLPETKPDAIGFFEAVALAGLEGQYVRIPAATQRRHFGCAPFGKLAVKVESNRATTIKSMDYGRDFDKQTAYWSMAEKAWVSPVDHKIQSSFPKA